MHLPHINVLTAPSFALFLPIFCHLISVLLFHSIICKSFMGLYFFIHLTLCQPILNSLILHKKRRMVRYIFSFSAFKYVISVIGFNNLSNLLFNKLLKRNAKVSLNHQKQRNYNHRIPNSSNNFF